MQTFPQKTFPRRENIATLPSPCCVPTHFQSLTVLYFHTGCHIIIITITRPWPAALAWIKLLVGWYFHHLILSNITLKAVLSSKLFLFRRFNDPSNPQKHVGDKVRLQISQKDLTIESKINTKILDKNKRKRSKIKKTKLG